MNVKKYSLFLCMTFLFQINVIDAAEEKDSDRLADNRKRKGEESNDSMQKKVKSFRDEIIDSLKNNYLALQEGFGLLELDFNVFLEAQRHLISDDFENDSDGNWLNIVDQIVVAAENVIIERAQGLLEREFDAAINNGTGLDRSTMRIFDYAMHYRFDLGERMFRRFASTTSLLASAVDHNNIEIVKFLIQEGVDVNSGRGIALKRATEHGHVEIVRMLIEAGADVNSEDDTALMYAAEHGHVEIVRMLIKAGADVNSEYDDQTGLKLAVKNDYVEIARMLIDAGAGFHEEFHQGWSELITAADNGNVEMVRLLIDAGEDVNYETSEEYTALIAAVGRGPVEMVRMLLAEGANLETYSWDSQRVLVTANDRGNVEIIQIITTEINKSKGYTPLMLAVADGDTEKVKALIATGVNVDAIDYKGNTALMITTYEDESFVKIKEDEEEIIKALIVAGANVEIQNQSGDTVIDMADEDMRQVIQEAIAQRNAENSALDSLLDHLENSEDL